MIYNFTAGIQRFYIFCLTVLLGLFLFGLNHYYKAGVLDSTDSSGLDQSLAVVDELKSGQTMAEVFSLIAKDNPSSASKIIHKVEEGIKSVGANLDSQSQVEISNKVTAFKGELDNLVTLPETEKVLAVLSAKVRQFFHFVKSNNWRTLTRMSGRTLAKLQNFNKASSPARVLKLHRGILQDINVMRNVTNSSILPSDSKKQILRRIDRFKTEVSMLGEIAKNKVALNKNYESLRMSLDKWLDQVSPQLQLKKLEYSEKGKEFIQAQIGFAILLLLSIVFGIVFVSKSKTKNNKIAEGLILSAVNDYLLAEEDKNVLEGSSSFQTEMGRLREYVRKRMSLGKVVKETLPLSMVVFDQNLKLVWGNQEFYEIFGLDFTVSSDEQVTWDQVKTKTNLGESDPIIDTLKSNIDGIFQIQIKSKSHDSTKPYEMFVHSFDDQKDKRIVLYFYSLSSMEETINDQLISITGPIKNTLSKYIAGTVSKNILEGLKSDFQNAGIEGIHSQFESLYEKNSAQQKALFAEIEKLELESQQTLTYAKDIHSQQESKKSEFNKGMSFLNEAKKEIANYVEANVKSEEKFLEVQKIVSHVMDNYLHVLGNSERLFKKLDSNCEAVSSFDGLRKEYKDLLNGMRDSRVRLTQSVDQTAIFKRSGYQDPEKIEVGFNKIKENIKVLERILTDFEKKIVSFDLKMSKAQMLLEPSPDDITLEQMQEMSSNFKKIETSLKFNLHSLQDIYSQNLSFEEKLVSHFREFNSSVAKLAESDGAISQISERLIEHSPESDQSLNV